MALYNFREKANLSLYASKERNLNILKYSSFCVSALAISVLISLYGLKLSFETQVLMVGIIKATTFFYVFAYLVKFLYTFEPVTFFRQTWLEGILISTIFLDGVSNIIFHFPIFEQIFVNIGFTKFPEFYAIFIQFYLFLIAAIDFSKIVKSLPSLKLSPSTLFAGSFIVIIFFGAGLLMLPQMTVDNQGLKFMDALFTSVSACCVTGLTVVDTATVFTMRGQAVLIFLMQMGGLSIIAFATFIAVISGTKVGIKQQSMMKEYFSADSLFSTKGLIRQIILLSFGIELIGAILIYALLGDVIPEEQVGRKIFYSIFHAVSAFNNAGFALFTNGLFESGVRDLYLLHLVIALLIILGGLGFSQIRDLFGIENLRNRLKYPWKTLKIGTQVALYSSIALVTLGTIAFFILEQNNTLSNQPLMAKIITSFFQSVTTRTAGFNTVDFSVLGTPILIIMIFLMFIGASSGSTGGGIKTSTFTLLILAAISSIKGKRNYELGKNSISFELMNRAFSLAFFASGVVFLGVFILTLTDPQIPVIQLVFEEVSAFATTGLSTGITSSLSQSGKIVLMVSMFIGRIGILTLAVSLSTEALSKKYKYPNAHLMVG